MNGFHPSTNFIGATGEYPVYDFIKNTSNILINQIFNTSNVLQQYTIDTENILQTQITDTCNLIYRDENKNTVIRITAQNPFYPSSGIPIEMLFKPLEGEPKTKIDYQGVLRIYHQETAFLPTVTTQWISVPDAIVYLLQEDIQWNAVNANNDAHFALIDAKTLELDITANAGLMTAITAEGIATTALGEATTNSVQISIINNTLPTLITSNHLYNFVDGYSEERRYPPKLYNNRIEETTTTLLNKTVFVETLILNTDNISYGSGDYVIYSSSTHPDLTRKKYILFNENLTENPTFFGGTLWNLDEYTGSTGLYSKSNFIVSGYTGDWIIIKLPNPIILTKYRFYHRSNTINRAPSLWRCYGSDDGIDFTEIQDASNDVDALTSSHYVSGDYYEKVVNSNTNISYLYIGFTFRKLVGGSNAIVLNFNELQLYGTEVIGQQPETIYYNKTESDSLLNSKENNLTFTEPLTRTINTIGINLSDYLLKTGNINLNQINDWITTQYGTYYDITNGTLAINATPTQEDILKVGGQTTIQGELIAEGKIKENDLYLSDVYLTKTAGLAYNSWTKSDNDIYQTIPSGNIGIGTSTNIGKSKLIVNGLLNTNGVISGFGNGSNVYPNIPGNYIIIRHNTFHGNIGTNNPNPECAYLMINNNSGAQMPWGFYNGVVKYFASTSPHNSLRNDIGSCSINNTLATQTGTNTFTPLLSILYTGNIGIGNTAPLYKLDVNGTMNASNIYKIGIDIDNIYIYHQIHYSVI